MMRIMHKSKIHKGVVTDANLNYAGSITIDEMLMKESNLLENEKVLIVDINNGERFETYVIKGERGSGTLCLNGAAARLVQVGDRIIIISFGIYDQSELADFKSKVVVLNEKNQIVENYLK